MARRPVFAIFSPLLVTLVCGVVALVLYVNYGAHFSAVTRASTVNGRNMRRVRLGMDTIQVYGIMGPPLYAAHFTWPAVETVYGYKHRPGTSDSY